MGLEISRTDFYNLLRKRDQVKLSDQEEARVVITYLDDHGSHVFVDEQYVLNNLGNRT